MDKKNMYLKCKKLYTNFTFSVSINEKTFRNAVLGIKPK